MKRKLKNLILASLLLLSSLPVFALEEYVSHVYTEIDKAFSDRSEQILDGILKKYQEDKYYYLMENYSMKKVRRLIISKDYDFAITADFVIIDNNLENEEAVELYATISEAYEAQKLLVYQNEELERKEELRVENLKEAQRVSAEKQYNTITTSSGNVVYVTGKDGGQLSRSGWDLNIGIVPGFVTNSASGLKTISIGFGYDLGYYRILKSYNIGCDASGSFEFLKAPLSAVQDNSIFFSGNVKGKIAFRDLTDKFFIRAGIDAQGLLQGDVTKVAYDQTLQKTIISPTIGVKLVDIPLGNMMFDMSTDWLMAHLWTDGLKFAMSFDSSLKIPFAELERVRLNFVVGLKDVVFMKQNGFENRLNLVLALGGCNVK